MKLGGWEVREWKGGDVRTREKNVPEIYFEKAHKTAAYNVSNFCESLSQVINRVCSGLNG